MGCERSVVTMTLIRLNYLVHSLGNCATLLSIETGLSHVKLYYNKEFTAIIMHKYQHQFLKQLIDDDPHSSRVHPSSLIPGRDYFF